MLDAERSEGSADEGSAGEELERKHDPRFKFDIGDLVTAKTGEKVYQCRIEARDYLSEPESDDEDKEQGPQYKVHYLGWGKRYDEWMFESRIRKLRVPKLKKPNRKPKPKRPTFEYTDSSSSESDETEQAPKKPGRPHGKARPRPPQQPEQIIDDIGTRVTRFSKVNKETDPDAVAEVAEPLPRDEADAAGAKAEEEEAPKKRGRFPNRTSRTEVPAQGVPSLEPDTQPAADPDPEHEPDEPDVQADHQGPKRRGRKPKPKVASADLEVDLLVPTEPPNDGNQDASEPPSRLRRSSIAAAASSSSLAAMRRPSFQAIDAPTSAETTAPVIAQESGQEESQQESARVEEAPKKRGRWAGHQSKAKLKQLQAGLACPCSVSLADMRGRGGSSRRRGPHTRGGSEEAAWSLGKAACRSC